MSNSRQLRVEADSPCEPPSRAEKAAGRLLRVVRDLAVELHPRRAATLSVALDSALDRDLGFDSLGRVELLLRIERAFGVQLPEELLGQAETPRDLLNAVLEAEPGAAARIREQAVLPALEAIEAAPHHARTLTEVLDWHLRTHPDRPHVLLPGGADGETTLTYRTLAEPARVLAHGLRQAGLAPGGRVAIMLPTGAAFFHAFFGALYAGGVPVPVYPPLRRTQIEEHLRRQAGILRNAGAEILIAMPEARGLAGLLRPLAGDLRRVVTVAELSAAEAGALPETLAAASMALIQYTSGSTGDPKGVVLSHDNLLSNIRAMGERMKASAADRFVSWLPLYHDMGLIGAWLGTLYYAAPTVIMSPLRFMARPHSWLWAIHRHRATLSAAPNFAFELCLHKVKDRALEGLDLGSLRMVANGAEAVSAETIRRFTARFAPYGFRPEAMAPVYGLAESAVGLAFPPPGRRPIIDRIRREALARRGEALPAPKADPEALELVSCGQPLPGHEIRVVDARQRELSERHQGRLQFRGPSATRGYFRNADKTRELFVGDWLDSGDLAYVAGGEIFVTGRVKDMIIRAGRNIYPQEVEAAVGKVEGLRRGCTAVFGSPDPKSGTERLVVLAETRASEPEALAELHRRVMAAAVEVLDEPPEEVVLAPPHSVPKTSSGKLRRAAARRLYEEGRIGARPRALWWQVARLSLAGLRPRVQHGLAALAELLYAGYWWIVLAVTAGIAWPLVVLLPRRAWRWALLRPLLRLALRLMGTPLEVSGLESLPAAGAILVANHASYLDGLVLVAALPGETAFVAKTELAAQVFAGRFLPRLGAVFVERVDPERGARDTQSALAAARAGRRLLFFPEGTLSRMPGLMAFHLGAFVAAVEAGLPVVPVTLRGTRSILRGDQWFPRRGAVSLHVGRPIPPDGGDFAAVLELRDAARAAILARCGEPDLGQ
jgi:1-acyl-sn-glycerol-3-phosphate acyltransferase